MKLHNTKIRLVGDFQSGAAKEFAAKLFTHIASNKCKHATVTPRPLSNAEIDVAYALLTLDKDSLDDPVNYVTFQDLAEETNKPVEYIARIARNLGELTIVHQKSGNRAPMFVSDEDISGNIILSPTETMLTAALECETSKTCCEKPPHGQQVHTQ